MTFLHKLAQRLARMRATIAVALLVFVAVLGCELPLADTLGSISRLFLSPKNSTLRAGQVTQFYAVGLGSAGDTFTYTARWKISGGTILDTGTNGGKHYVSYRSPDQPGRFTVVSQSMTTNLVDTAFVNVTAVPVASVVVAPSAANFTPGQTLQFGAIPQDSTGTPLSGRVVTWNSSNTGVATVSGGGMVTGVGGGSATITATSEGKSGTATVSVTQTAAPVATVTVTPASPTVAMGQTVQLVATPRDANGTALAGRVITWTSSNPAIALVGGGGMVTAVAAGTVTITATSEGKSGTASVTVTQPVASITVSPSSATVLRGQSTQLVATPRDAAGNALTGRVIAWGSNNTGVATVNGSGLVIAIASGAALITATSEGKSGSSAITVPPPPVAAVSISPSSPTVGVGQSVQLSTTLQDVDGNVLTGRTVTWTSGNAGIVTVSTSGLATGIAAGSATITATSEGKSGSVTVAVTAAPPPPVATVTVSPSSPSVTVGQTVQLGIVLRDAAGNVLTGRVVTWSSGNTGVATVSGSGLARGIAAGSTTITATSEGKSGSVTLTVTAAPPPPPSGGGGWPHAPAGWTIVTNNDFGPGDGWNYYGPTVIQDPTAPVSPSVLQFRFPAGHPGGTSPGPIERLWPGGVSSHFVGFWIKLSNPFDNRFGVKAWYPGPNGGYFMVIEGDNKGGAAGTLRIESGGTNYESNIAIVRMTPGSWHQVEILVDKSAGKLRFWVDGTLCGDHNVVLGGTPEEARFYPVWGGTGDVMQYNSYMWFDHYFLSRP